MVKEDQEAAKLGPALAFLQELTQHRFKNLANLSQALTHASARNKGGANGRALSEKTQEPYNYERLEFLGDRILGLLISEMLCSFFPEASEGELSVRLNGLVNAQTCAEIAIESNLYRYIIMGPEMKNLEERRLYNIYADVVESLIAVIYLEGGLDAVRPFIKRFWQERAKASDGAKRDPKSILQEWAHQHNCSMPIYSVLACEGPDHAPLFKMQVTVDGYEPAFGQGPSKRAAQHEAAKNFLERQQIANDAL